MYQHVLIPTDGSSLSSLAVDQGTRLARSLGASVTLVHVTASFAALTGEMLVVSESEDTYVAAMQRLSRTVLGEARRVVEAAGVRCQTIHRTGDQPWHEILETARQEGCDLIAMASHGRSGLAAVVLGSETTKVITHSRIPVLVYR